MAGRPESPELASSEKNDPCSGLVQEANHRLAAATTARAAERGLVERLIAAREDQGERNHILDEASRAADHGRFDELRARAQDAFRAAVTKAGDAAEIAEAGSRWMAEVDRITDEAAATHARHQRARADALIATALVEHLTAEADAARRLAEGAESTAVEARRRADACLAEAAARAAELAAAEAARAAELAAAEAARVEAERAVEDAAPAKTARADLERAGATETAQSGTAVAGAAAAGGAAMAATGEAAAAAASRPPGARSPEGAALALGLTRRGPEPDDAPPRDDGGRLTPRSTLSRILAGDLALLEDVAGRLSDDHDEAARWRAQLAALCEALLQRAIDTGALTVPSTHEFWSAFTAEQGRDILSALAALGYRADGRGGWQDDRIPAQRELSIAVAHAGLDPMRIRRWPALSEAMDLIREAEVMGGEYVAAMAPSLAARELRLILGREAERFSDLWDAWERIRPLLLEAGRAAEP